jgi:C4-dicarboxylate-specific signal transduction histidine kinase
LLTDIEDRTQALARLQQMQSDFAHMNRVSLMGELAASLSHEIAQPIASARNNARAAQNFLERQPQDMARSGKHFPASLETQIVLEQSSIASGSKSRKAPPRKECFDLNAAIDEAATLSHEILHPIATARNNAWSGMRFLEMSPPNLDKAKVALGCVVRDADRAKDIVGRMRDQIKKAPPRKERFDLNAAINEVLVLAKSVTTGTAFRSRLGLWVVASSSGGSHSAATGLAEPNSERG